MKDEKYKTFWMKPGNGLYHSTRMLLPDQPEGAPPAAEGGAGSNNAPPAGEVPPAGEGAPPPDQKPPEGAEPTVESLTKQLQERDARIEQVLGEKKDIEGKFKQFRRAAELDRHKAQQPPATQPQPPGQPPEPQPTSVYDPEIQDLLAAKDRTTSVVERMIQANLKGFADKLDGLEANLTNAQKAAFIEKSSDQFDKALTRIEAHVAQEVGELSEDVPFRDDLKAGIATAVDREMASLYGCRDHYEQLLLGKLPWETYSRDHQLAYRRAYQDKTKSLADWQTSQGEAAKAKKAAAVAAQSGMVGAAGAAIPPEVSALEQKFERGEISEKEYERSVAEILLGGSID
jgi:hypothetical protein